MHRAEEVNGSNGYPIFTLTPFGVEVGLTDQLGRPVLDNVPLEASLTLTALRERPSGPVASAVPAFRAAPARRRKPPLRGDVNEGDEWQPAMDPADGSG